MKILYLTSVIFLSHAGYVQAINDVQWGGCLIAGGVGGAVIFNHLYKKSARKDDYQSLTEQLDRQNKAQSLAEKAQKYWTAQHTEDPTNDLVQAEWKATGQQATLSLGDMCMTIAEQIQVETEVEKKKSPLLYRSLSYMCPIAGLAFGSYFIYKGFMNK